MRTPLTTSSSGHRKSRLGIFYVDHHTFVMDLKLIFLTVKAIASRPAALRSVSAELQRHGAPDALVQVALRTDELKPGTPP